MHNVLAVKIPYTDDQLGGQEFSLLFCEALVSFEDLVELATINEGHDEVQAKLRLKDVINPTKERMVGLQEDLHLEDSVFNCALSQNFVLSNGLHGILLFRALVLAKVNTTKSSRANLHEQIKVVKCDIRTGDHARTLSQQLRLPARVVYDVCLSLVGIHGRGYVLELFIGTRGR